MDDIKMDGAKPAPAWFWISLALMIIATIILLLLLRDGRQDQINIEKKTTYHKGKLNWSEFYM